MKPSAVTPARFEEVGMPMPDDERIELKKGLAELDRDLRSWVDDFSDRIRALQDSLEDR